MSSDSLLRQHHDIADRGTCLCILIWLSALLVGMLYLASTGSTRTLIWRPNPSCCSSAGVLKNVSALIKDQVFGLISPLSQCHPA